MQLNKAVMPHVKITVISIFLRTLPIRQEQKLIFHRTSVVKFKVRPLYEGPSCTEIGRDKATLVVDTPVSYIRKLLDKPEIEFTITVVAGDALLIRVNNPKEQQCGQAMVRLLRDSATPQLFFVAGYALVWLAVGLLLLQFRMGSLGIWGAVIHASYIYSETLYQQILSIALGPTLLVVLAGMGIIFLPFISRLTQPISLLFFIFVTIVLVFFPLINIGNFWLTGNTVDIDAVHAIFQTNTSELFQFLNDNYSAIELIVVFGFIASCSGLITWKLTRAVTTPFLGGLGVIFLTLAILYAGRISNDLSTFRIWGDATIRYYQELRAFHDLAVERKSMSDSHDLHRSSGDRVTVLVIGESHNRRHMSLYGYPRDTTPKLVQRHRDENLIVFDNAYSNHTHTNPSLSLSLTEANQYDDKSWVTMPSLITFARQAGIKTYWISNQQMLGIWDNAVALLAKESNNIVSINKKIGIRKSPNHKDDALIPHLYAALQDAGEKLIIVHLSGSHGGYCSRFPKAWNAYTGELKLSLFGKAHSSTNVKKINCYDNSVLYNDYVLNLIFDSLEKSGLPASALYFADHSEDVFGGKGHNSLRFGYGMTEIPMVFSASNLWRREFSGHWNQLLMNRKEIFTNDLVFETVLGLMGLESSHIKTKYDIGHEHFEGVETPKTLHGRISLKDNSNYNLWQRMNVDLMIRNNLEKRVLPHRVNTIGKLYEITKVGLRSFEVEIIFRTRGEFFEVGHHEGVMTGMTLESFLEKVPPDFEKIWLDIKNATNTTIPGINNRLLELDKKFGLKNRVIIETNNNSTFPSLLSNGGFHLSYYLPTEETLVIMGEDDKVRKFHARKLAGIAESQNVSAVSFNLRLYKFVKDYLETKLHQEIVYHTWSTDTSFRSSNLLDEMRTQKYFQDPRVETILLPYASPFSL